MTEDYRKARRLGRREVGRALAAGRNPFPPALDEVVGGRPFSRRTSLGCLEIPLDQVVGTRTRGRQNVFSERFMPLADEGTEFAAKWSRLMDAQLAEGFRDPIVVQECMHRFYVQEGNKRVSVARYVGMPSIRAEVERVVPVADGDAAAELAAYEEFERFFSAVPLYDIDLPHPGDYERLARLLERDIDARWPEDDVRHLKAAFLLFSDTFAHRGGARLECTASEAFLLYLQTFCTSSPLDATPQLMDQRLGALWDELRVLAPSDSIAFVAEPAPQRKGMVSRVVSKVRPPRATRVAFVYDRTPATSGWTLLHDVARRELSERMGDALWTVSFEGCGSDESFERAVRLAADDGCDLVVTTSPRQMEQTRRAAAAHRGMSFANCSVNLTSGSVRTFYARMYEVKFLMGALAASLSLTHQVGYLAFSPINGAIAEANAFALGAALVDPHATVHLKWLSESAAWQEELAGLGADVVAGRDYVDPTCPDAPFGLYALDAGNALPVATPIWDWTRYYELMIGEFAARGRGDDRAWARGQAINYWWGMAAGVVRLELAEGVAQGQRRLVEMLENALLEGRLDPFGTTLVDQRAQVVRREGDPPLADEQIASMSWLNINVSGHVPAIGGLSQGGRADVEAAGVVPPRPFGE